MTTLAEVTRRGYPAAEGEVYRRLRREIILLEFEPDARLRLEQLASRYNVSLTPIRHALRRLESEGLVVSQSRRGARVAPVTPAEAEEIQLKRLGMESRLARLGARRCTDEAIAEMRTWRRQIEDAYRAHDAQAYVQSFWPFRDACYRCASRPRLIEAVNHERTRVERYVLFLRHDLDAFADLRDHQDRFLQRCIERDGERAARLTEQSILWVLDQVQKLLRRRSGHGTSGEDQMMSN